MFAQEKKDLFVPISILAWGMNDSGMMMVLLKNMGTIATKPISVDKLLD